MLGHASAFLATKSSNSAVQSSCALARLAGASNGGFTIQNGDLMMFNCGLMGLF
jgi:hypothetical protein